MGAVAGLQAVVKVDRRKVMADVAVPAEFPHDPFPASLSGAQAKFSARLVNGRYVVGLTTEERTARYLMCQDLVDQLLSYFRRKADEHPEWSCEDLLCRVEKGVASRQTEWELGSPEVEWIIARVREGARMDRGLSDCPGDA
ncbi:hypothetical protein AWV79_24275 [Cupriavidus sp. UYMMa02A]|nr:hypothetical protein AWV79_24275 [Cupriavidus sp. UYMMa02A]